MYQNQPPAITAVLAAAAFAAFTAPAEPISARLLDAVSWVESNHRHAAVGDAGAARSAWQLHRGAWADASAYLRRHGHATAGYNAGVNDPVTARTHAAAYLGLINGQLKKRLGREPNAGELYAAYNLGVGGFAKRGFDINRTPSITHRGVAKLRARMEVAK